MPGVGGQVIVVFGKAQGVFAAQVLEGASDGHTAHPALEGAAAVVLTEVAEDSEEGILQDVLRFGAVAGIAQANTEQRRFVFFKQLALCGAVAPTAGRKKMLHAVDGCWMSKTRNWGVPTNGAQRTEIAAPGVFVFSAKDTKDAVHPQKHAALLRHRRRPYCRYRNKMSKIIRRTSVLSKNHSFSYMVIRSTKRCGRFKLMI